MLRVGGKVMMESDKQETVGVVEKKAESGADLFLWANQMEPLKGEVKLELFLFNKNYTPYKVKMAEAILEQARVMFVAQMVNFVNSEVEKGLKVRELGTNVGEDEVVSCVELKKVGRLETLIHVIEKEYAEIEFFKEADHDFRRIKGIIARCEVGDKKFFVAKQIQPTAALRSVASWELKGQTFEPFRADLGIKIPDDEQVLVVEDTVFVFNQGKFERLFQFDAKTEALAEEKIAEIMQSYSLAFPEGVSLASLLQGKKPLIKKLSNLEIGEMSQDKVIEYADEMQLELMTDDNGAVIIMDDADLTGFVNLLSEDYFISSASGKRYEVKSKKLMREPEGGEPPRG
ncbi:DUF4868 domain-containing protein [Candidatus Saccharibacteria bacterium]|nr:DUF4868 domain-containing protein [Candidatus Saccharibacteria bacterium]